MRAVTITEELNSPDWSNSRRIRIDLTTNDEQLLGFAAHVAQDINSQRKKAYSDQQLSECERHLRIVLLNLFTAWNSDSTLTVGYSIGKPNFQMGGSYWDELQETSFIRYAYFRDVIDFLSAQGLIHRKIATAGRNNYSSRMIATQDLIDLFEGLELNGASTIIDLDGPTIIMKDENKNIVSYPEAGAFDVRQASQNIRRINENLQSTQLNLEISDETSAQLVRRFRRLIDEGDDADLDDARREPIDFSNRSIRRIFAGNSFELGGRFYGGWWQGVPSEYRKHIEIDGCMTVELDFSTLQPTIMYALAEMIPPEDSYILPGWDPNLRSIIKKAFNQLINCAPSTSNPNQWHRLAPSGQGVKVEAGWEIYGPNRIRGLLRDKFHEFTGRDYDDLIRDLLNFHEPIGDQFFSGAWGRMQNLDSQIAERTMLRLLDATPPITALPIHDSFIVRRGAEGKLNRIMKEEFLEVIGGNANIHRDPAVFDALEGYQPTIVFGENLHEQTRERIQSHAQYYLREDQWERVWGPLG